jgi:23S rRNA U2552 (ribose-2'-O)-methylase RlmE/FtsJ
VKRYSPEASRSSSSEIYVIAKGFGKGTQGQSG